MNRQLSLLDRFYRLRSGCYKRKRIVFASPAEVMLIRVMGGWVLTLPFWRDPENHFPAIVVLSMGQVFKNERVQREVRVGGRYIDFGNDIQRGIEVDGRDYHGDIVKQIERDEYFQKYGWRVLHIAAADVYNKPRAVRRLVVKHLTR